MNNYFTFTFTAEGLISARTNPSRAGSKIIQILLLSAGMVEVTKTFGLFYSSNVDNINSKVLEGTKAIASDTIFTVAVTLHHPKLLKNQQSRTHFQKLEPAKRPKFRSHFTHRRSFAKNGTQCAHTSLCTSTQ